MHTHTHMYTHACIHMQTSYRYLCTHAHTHTQTHAYIHPNTCPNTHPQTHTHTHTYTHRYTFTQTHGRKPSYFSDWHCTGKWNILQHNLLKCLFRSVKEFVWRVISSLWSSLPLLVFGAGRLLAVKATDYHEHVSEYGVHWNFFFTLAIVKVRYVIVLPRSLFLVCMLLFFTYHTVFRAHFFFFSFTLFSVFFSLGQINLLL